MLVVLLPALLHAPWLLSPFPLWPRWHSPSVNVLPRSTPTSGQMFGWQHRSEGLAILILHISASILAGMKPWSHFKLWPSSAEISFRELTDDYLVHRTDLSFTSKTDKCQYWQKFGHYKNVHLHCFYIKVSAKLYY